MGEDMVNTTNEVVDKAKTFLKVDGFGGVIIALAIIVFVVAIVFVIVSIIKKRKKNKIIGISVAAVTIVAVAVLFACGIFSGSMYSNLTLDEMLQVAKTASVEEFTFSKTQSREGQNYISSVYMITGYVIGIGFDNTFVVVADNQHGLTNIILYLNQEDMKRVQKDTYIAFVAEVTYVKNIFNMSGYLLT